MADYKELLRRAVDALPENNGAARRAVYEKARAALVGQLRAINPPLPARDITSHRLQLEDCIRQVEQEASEANIAGMGIETHAAPPTLPPVFAAEARINATSKPAPEEAPPRKTVEPRPQKAKQPPADKPVPVDTGSIEDIIAAAERAGEPDEEPAEAAPRPPKSQPVLVAKAEPPAKEQLKPEAKRPVAAPGKPDGRGLPSIVARAEAAKGRPIAPGFGAAADAARRAPTIEPRRDARAFAATARQVEPVMFDTPEDDVAMSTVREVEVEAAQPPAAAQNVIDRAIATLDREARGDARPAEFDDTEERADEPAKRKKKTSGFFTGRSADVPVLRGEPRDNRTPRPAKEFATPRRSGNRAFAEGGVPRAQRERSGLGPVTIFLIIFAVLIVGAGGAGFWAWQEDIINLDTMFGKGTPTVATAANTEPVVTPDSTGPGNTETPVAATEPATELRADDRLTSMAALPSAETQAVAPLALQSPVGGDNKTEERLGGAGANQTPETAAQAVAAIDPASVNGSQSLLLEASDNGTTGAVPFSGTVEWTKGTDETGKPTLVGKANIPARNLSVDVLIRKNSDPSLPASHLMEINFSVSDSFIGGSIAGLPGVLLKNEELVQGAPLVGASARVVGNSFLFALSAAPEDSTANVNLLTSRKWMDLALIYASGKRAIITLEKDAKAQALFSDVFASWAKASAG
jgi:hypothetical protein